MRAMRLPPLPLLATVIVLLAATLAACGEDGGQASGAGSHVRVVATTTQVADLARGVAGERADVHALLRPEADPHDYEPRPSDAEAIAGAGVVLASGGDLDEWLDDLVQSAGAEAPVVTLIDRVRARPGDPHWWHDPRNAVTAVEAIRDALARADPEGRAAYERNARAYAARIERLDREVGACMGRVPAAQRKLVTTHDALGSFAERYDIEVIGSVLDSLSTQAQPSAGDTRELVEQMRAERVRVLFAESSVAPRLEKAIAREAGARVGDALYADTLGPEGSPGATYLGSIAANADAMVRGFTAGRDRCPAGAAR
jgi:zinc/manganese transport system substrate-binding protein